MKLTVFVLIIGINALNLAFIKPIMFYHPENGLAYRPESVSCYSQTYELKSCYEVLVERIRALRSTIETQDLLKTASTLASKIFSAGKYQSIKI